MRPPQNELAMGERTFEMEEACRRRDGHPARGGAAARRRCPGRGPLRCASAAVILLLLSGSFSIEAFVATEMSSRTRRTAAARSASAGLWGGRYEATIRGSPRSQTRTASVLLRAGVPNDAGPGGDSSSGNWSEATAVEKRKESSRLSAFRGEEIATEKRKESRFGVRRRLRSILSATVDVDGTDAKESRLGVRRRVRSVLAKARSRTGIQNSSDEKRAASSGSPAPPSLTQAGTPLKTTLSALDVVAEAASIGGLGAVVVDEESGAVDVALDYVPLPGKTKGSKEGSSVDANGAAGGNGTGTGTTAAAAAAAAAGEVAAAAARAAAPASVATTTTTTTTTTAPLSPPKKPSPASTPSSPIVPPPEPNPEDSFVPASPKSKREVGGIGGDGDGDGDGASKAAKAKVSAAAYSELDAFKGDVSAAFSMPPDPLPFTLPDLSPSQSAELMAGERVQFQADMGREGNGYVVLDVKAPAEVIWDTLLDFQSYPDTIPTVRGVTMYTTVHKPDGRVREMALPPAAAAAAAAPRDRSYRDGTRAVLKHGVASVTRAAFTLSKFRLRIAAVHKYRPHPQGDYMVFTLDPTSSNVVLRSAKGVWHTQSNPDGKGEEYTRVWLLCELKVSPLLPQWITDYAAKRAMPRATTWLKPTVEAMANGNGGGDGRNQ